MITVAKDLTQFGFNALALLAMLIILFHLACSPREFSTVGWPRVFIFLLFFSARVRFGGKGGSHVHHPSLPPPTFTGGA
jgi:hypothetical protein